jgi:hypothetical protein
VRRGWTWWLAWGTFGLFWLLTMVTVALDASEADRAGEESLLTDVGLVIAFNAFVVVGALVASRQPRNAVGWLFLAAPLFAMTAGFSEQYAHRALIGDAGELPAGLVVGWLYLWTWYPAIGMVGLVALLFPDGRVPGRRWRWVLGAYAGLLTVGTIGAAVYPTPIFTEEVGSPTNPLGMGPLEGILDLGAPVVFLLLIPLTLAILLSVVVRYRRSAGDERLQLKCMLAGVMILPVQIVISEVFHVHGSAGDLLFALAVAAIPIAAGIAMLKYRLYDVDVVIRKTLVYGVLSAVLAATYVGLVLAGQALFASFAGGSDLAIAASTLVVAALFLPVRARLQRFVDRRFYRRRYDAQRTLEAFGVRLREEVDLETLTGELHGIVTDTMQPAHVSLWLREAPR